MEKGVLDGKRCVRRKKVCLEEEGMLDGKRCVRWKKVC